MDRLAVDGEVVIGRQLLLDRPHVGTLLLDQPGTQHTAAVGVALSLSLLLVPLLRIWCEDTCERVSAWRVWFRDAELLPLVFADPLRCLPQVGHGLAPRWAYSRSAAWV